jgi:hypothetical protein
VSILRARELEWEKQRCDVDAWLRVIRKYTELEELTAEVLLELVDTIEVFEPQKVDGKRVCRVHIVYRFVGNVGEALLETEVYDGKAV